MKIIKTKNYNELSKVSDSPRAGYYTFVIVTPSFAIRNISDVHIENTHILNSEYFKL